MMVFENASVLIGFVCNTQKRAYSAYILHHEILQADEMQLGHLGLERGRSDVLSILFHLHLPYHTIHVWYIYLHLVELYGFHVGKYTSPMDGMG